MKVSGREPEAFVARKTERRRQKAGCTVAFFDRDRGVWQRNDRYVLYAEFAVFQLYLVVYLYRRLIGGLTLTAPTISADKILRLVDKLMYVVKNNGKNNIKYAVYINNEEE